MYPSNHYVLVLQHNYTKQTAVIDVYNGSTDKLFYKFKDFEFPENITPGEISYCLFWCTLDYSIELSNSLLDSKITVTTGTGDTYTMTLGDVVPETGTILYPDLNKPVGEQAIDNPVGYYSL